MRVVLDTNVLISALLVDSSLPAQLVAHWRRGRFVLLTTALQLDEVRRVTRYPKIRARLKPVLAGRLINDLREITVPVETLPTIDVSRDPYDNYLLALAVGGEADISLPATNLIFSNSVNTKEPRSFPSVIL